MKIENVTAVILCGGLGTRLSEETVAIPKPMVRIGGKPILWHIMKHYSHFGINRFVLTLGYMGERIKEYFINYELLNSDFTVELGKMHAFDIHSSKSEADWRVTLADTGLNTLKGGRIKRIERYVDNDLFMITYGDGVSTVDLNALFEFHLSHGKIGTLTGVHPPSRFGEIIVEGRDVIDFTEKPQVSTGLINGGFFLFNRGIFDYLTEDESCDFEYGPLQALANDGQLAVFEHKGFWECMDTLRDKNHLNRLWQEGRAEWKIWE